MGNPEKPSSAPAEAEGAIRAVSELALGSRIVYPNQGVCRVGEIQSKEIAGQRLDFVSMTREEDGATILVPVNKVPSIGLRHVADSNEIGDVFDLLASSFDDPELDWKVRHRMHGDLMSAGGVLGVAEVLKALQALANLRPLPQKERERYDAARHLLVHEVAVALGVPECTAEDFIDLALIPPPGTVRPASKPRRLATLPPKFLQKPVRAAPRAEGEELDDLGLLDEVELPGLGLEDEGLAEGDEEAGGEAEEEGGEAEAGAEAEEGEEKPKAKKAKAPAKPKKEKAPKSPAAKAATPAAEAPAPKAPVAEAPAPKGPPPAASIAAAAVEAPPAASIAAAAVETPPAPSVAATASEEAPEFEAPAPAEDEEAAAPAKQAPARKAAPADEAPRAAKAAAKKPAPKAESEAEAELELEAPAARASAKKAPAPEPKAKKPPPPAAKKAAAKEPPAKKAPAKKPAAKETPAKKPAAAKPKTAAKKK